MTSTELAEINPKEIGIKVIPPEASKPKAIDIQIDKKTDLRKHKQIEVFICKLFYRATDNKEYTWEVTKTVVSFKNFLSSVQYHLTKSRQQQKFSSLMSSISKISPMSYMQLKNYNPEDLKKLIDDINSIETNNTFIKEFFEISEHSFVPYNNGIKPKEGYIDKRAEYGLCQTTMIDLCNCVKCCCCVGYIKYWFLLKEDMICYLDSSTSQIGKNTFWFDKYVKLEKKGNAIVIRNSGKKLQLRFDQQFERDIWYNELNWRIEKFINNVKPNIYHSFVDEKNECKAKWFVDGKDYWADLRNRLLNAKETVYITDWWMSPEVWLTRPIPMKPYRKLKYGEAIESLDRSHLLRLCDILKHIADRGVKIYILVFCEVSFALTLNSKHTKTMLVNLSPNIKVTRHPKKSFDLLWSHHEKLVVIDQRYAYVGGLDLCWGRFDTHEHKLTDPENQEERYMFPGIDYSNARICDFMNVDNYLKESVERTFPRMPWHDIHSMLEGPAVLDIARHFVERWNFVKSYQNSEGITEVQTHYVKKKTLGGKLVPVEAAEQANILLDQKLKYNEEEKLDSDIHNNVPVNNSENIDGSKIDEEMNFDTVQILNKRTDKTHKVGNRLGDSHRPQQSGFSRKVTHLGSSLKRKFRMNFNSTKQKHEGIEHSVNLSSFKTTFSQGESKMRCQCLRSLSNWSGGLKETEKSIVEGYYHLIENAQHYIYIENQFFVSKSFTDKEHSDAGRPVSNLIHNEIALKLRDRIVKAHQNNEHFRVIIFIPLLPGFAGDVQSSSTLQVICKFTYKSISRNKGLSLIERLQELLDKTNPNLYKKYISFFSLRTHAMMNGVPVTELIYIHSKLMIVDDRVVIMGSANINDRSMTGERDSEFAVIYREDPNLDSVMDGCPYKASGFAKSLRVSIWKEHLGLEENDPMMKLLEDPVSDEMYDFMNKRALNNTLVYRDLFKCYPDDTFEYFKDVPQRKELTESEQVELRVNYEKRKNEIVGHIVQFPCYFLHKEILERSFFSAEMLVPIKNFV